MLWCPVSPNFYEETPCPANKTRQLFSGANDALAVIKIVHNNRFLCSDADVDIRDYSGRKPKHYITDRTSVWIQSKLTRMTCHTPPDRFILVLWLRLSTLSPQLSQLRFSVSF